MSEKWDHRYLALARHVAGWSKDPSTKTGAVVIRMDNIVAAIGFNGFPKEMQDRAEWYNDRDEKYSRIIHAEMNAVLHARRDDLLGATLYTWPLAPCDRCAVYMIQAGIERFVFPPLAPELEERWGVSIDRTKEYILQSRCEFVELNLEGG